MMPIQCLWNREPIPMLQCHHVTWIGPYQFQGGKLEYHHRPRKSNMEWERHHHHSCSINMENAKHYPNQWNHRPHSIWIRAVLSIELVQPIPKNRMTWVIKSSVKPWRLTWQYRRYRLPGIVNFVILIVTQFGIFQCDWIIKRTW